MVQETIIVTGASSGLGLAIAARLVKDRAQVVGTSRHAPKTLEFSPAGLAMVQLDVRDDGSVEAFRARLVDAGVRARTAVLNAGYGISGAIEETSAEAAMAQFDTNLIGTHRVVRALLPGLREQGGGHLIIIGSLAGRIALPFQGFYSASKAALASYAEALRIELRPFGITVTLVEPGDHRTGFPDRREAQHRGPTSPYEPQQSRVLAEMVASEAAGASAESLAELVARIVAAKRPRRHYFKMSAFERMFVFLRAVLPGAWFEAAVRQAYELA